MEVGYHIFIGEDNLSYDGAARGLEFQINEAMKTFDVKPHGGCTCKIDDNTKSHYMIIHAVTLTEKK